MINCYTWEASCNSVGIHIENSQCHVIVDPFVLTFALKMLVTMIVTAVVMVDLGLLVIALESVVETVGSE